MATVLKVEMAKRDFVVNDLANLAEKSREHIGKIVVGERTCEPGLAKTIARILKVPEKRLFVTLQRDRSRNRPLLMARHWDLKKDG